MPGSGAEDGTCSDSDGSDSDDGIDYLEHFSLIHPDHLTGENNFAARFDEEMEKSKRNDEAQDVWFQGQKAKLVSSEANAKLKREDGASRLESLNSGSGQAVQEQEHDYNCPTAAVPRASSLTTDTSRAYGENLARGHETLKTIRNDIGEQKKRIHALQGRDAEVKQRIKAVDKTTRRTVKVHKKNRAGAESVVEKMKSCIKNELLSSQNRQAFVAIDLPMLRNEIDDLVAQKDQDMSTFDTQAVAASSILIRQTNRKHDAKVLQLKNVDAAIRGFQEEIAHCKLTFAGLLKNDRLTRQKLRCERIEWIHVSERRIMIEHQLSQAQTVLTAVESDFEDTKRDIDQRAQSGRGATQQNRPQGCEAAIQSDALLAEKQAAAAAALGRPTPQPVGSLSVEESRMAQSAHAEEMFSQVRSSMEGDLLLDADDLEWALPGATPIQKQLYSQLFV